MMAQVDGDAVVEILRRDLVDGMPVVTGRIVDQCPDRAVGLDDRFDGMSQGINIPEIAAQVSRHAAALLPDAFDQPPAGLIIKINE